MATESTGEDGARPSRRAVMKGLAVGAGMTMAGVPLEVLGASRVDAAPGAPAVDWWSPLITFRTPDGRYAAPIHASLMPSGDVVLMGGARPTPDPDENMVFSRYAFTMRPHALNAALPAELVGTAWPEPMDVTNKVVERWLITDDLFCAGHSLTADGRHLTVGGIQSWKNLDTDEYVFIGLPYATVFDGTTWRRVAKDMVGKPINGKARRWYPTVTRLPGGRMLVTSGNDEIYPVHRVNLTIELFDPATEAWTLVSGPRSTPLEIWHHDYTHAIVLPKQVGVFSVLMFGEMGIPVLGTISTPMLWDVRTGRPRPGTEDFQAARLAAANSWTSEEAPNSGATTVPLPIRVKDGEWGYANGSVLISGGPEESELSQQVDVYDPVADAWHAPIATGVYRHDGASVVLPDGRILLVGGMGPEPDALHAGYVDPAAGFTYTAGTTATEEMRAYHGVAILLADGRVLTAGGRGADMEPWSEAPDMRYLYPPYLFRPRPVITTAPTQVRLNQTFTIKTTGPKPAEVVLMGLGSFTHCFDQNQRYVQLRTTAVAAAAGSTTAFTTTVVAPPSSTVAPLGHYLAFVLDAARTPSVAKVVQVIA